MHQPGVEVRPLRQMTGEAEFNEIFFTGARIPDSQRIGEVGQGWAVAIATLMNERVMLGRVGKVTGRQGGVVRHALRLWQRDAGCPSATPCGATGSPACGSRARSCA